MPRRTYSNRAGRRRPLPPLSTATLLRLQAELEQVAQTRRYQPARDARSLYFNPTRSN